MRRKLKCQSAVLLIAATVLLLSARDALRAALDFYAPNSSRIAAHSDNIVSSNDAVALEAEVASSVASGDDDFVSLAALLRSEDERATAAAATAHVQRAQHALPFELASDAERRFDLQFLSDRYEALYTAPHRNCWEACTRRRGLYRDKETGEVHSVEHSEKELLVPLVEQRAAHVVLETLTVCACAAYFPAQWDVRVEASHAKYTPDVFAVDLATEDRAALQKNASHELSAHAARALNTPNAANAAGAGNAMLPDGGIFAIQFTPLQCGVHYVELINAIVNPKGSLREPHALEPNATFGDLAIWTRQCPLQVMSRVRLNVLCDTEKARRSIGVARATVIGPLRIPRKSKCTLGERNNDAKVNSLALTSYARGTWVRLTDSSTSTFTATAHSLSHTPLPNVTYGERGAVRCVWPACSGIIPPVNSGWTYLPEKCALVYPTYAQSQQCLSSKCTFEDHMRNFLIQGWNQSEDVLWNRRNHFREYSSAFGSLRMGKEWIAHRNYGNGEGIQTLHDTDFIAKQLEARLFNASGDAPDFVFITSGLHDQSAPHHSYDQPAFDVNFHSKQYRIAAQNLRSLVERSKQTNSKTVWIWIDAPILADSFRCKAPAAASMAKNDIVRAEWRGIIDHFWSVWPYEWPFHFTNFFADGGHYGRRIGFHGMGNNMVGNAIALANLNAICHF